MSKTALFSKHPVNQNTGFSEWETEQSVLDHRRAELGKMVWFLLALAFHLFPQKSSSPPSHSLWYQLPPLPRVKSWALVHGHPLVPHLPLVHTDLSGVVQTVRMETIVKWNVVGWLNCSLAGSEKLERSGSS